MADLKSNDAVSGIILTAFDGALVGADIGDLSKIKTQEEGETMCAKGQALFNDIEDFAWNFVMIWLIPMIRHRFGWCW